MNEQPIDKWCRKLEFLQGKLASESDAAQQFKLEEEIRHAMEKIAELESQPPDQETECTPPMVVRSLPDNVNYYLRRLEGETSCLTLLGMGRSLQVELPIAEAYVPLRTTMARSMEERQTGRFKEGYAEHEEEVDLGQVFGKATQLDQHGVILLGEPGSGKTTNSRHATHPAYLARIVKTGRADTLLILVEGRQES